MIAVSFKIDTTAGGAYDSSTAGGVTGQPASGIYLLHAVEWVDGTLDNNVTAILSMTPASGVSRTLLDLAAGEADDDAWYFPQRLVHDSGGEDTTFYTHQVVTGPLKLVVAAGGATKTGRCTAYLLEA